MPGRPGPRSEIRAAATYTAATWTACDSTIKLESNANTLILYVTNATSTAGNVEFYVQHSADNGSTYYVYSVEGESPKIWGLLPFTNPISATEYRSIVLGGLEALAGETIKVYFRASVASTATLAITAEAIYAAAGASLSIGDVEVELEDLTHAEDAAHVSGDKGVQMLAVRKDTQAVLADTSGDYIPLTTNAIGRLTAEIGDATANAPAAFIDLDSGAGNEYVQRISVRTAASGGSVEGVKITDGSTYAEVVSGTHDALKTAITDGTSIVAVGTGTTKALLTSIHDGTNLAAVGTGTTKALLSSIHDGEKLAGVFTNSALADDVDGLNGLITTSVMHGYVDDNTTHTVLVDSNGHVQVDIQSFPGSLTGYEEDTGHSTGDKGILELAVRNDYDTSRTSADGDYSPKSVDISGREKVAVVGDSSAYSKIQSYAGTIASGGAAVTIDLNTAFGTNAKWVTIYCDGAGTLDVDFEVQSKVAGTHTGANDASVLTDSTANWRVDSLVGRTVTNVTDGSSGTITANTATTITATLAAGSENDWDTGDSYTIAAAYVPTTPHVMRSGEFWFIDNYSIDTLRLDDNAADVSYRVVAGA